MAGRYDFGGFVSVIRAVRTPLGFLTFIGLVLDTGLIGASVATDGMVVEGWIPAALLALIVVTVSAIAVFKPLALYHPSDWPARGSVTITLTFPSDSVPPNFRFDECKLEVRNRQGRERFSSSPQLRLGVGGWTIELDDAVVASDSVRLDLVDDEGKKWIVPPFAPYHKEIKPIFVQHNRGRVV